MPKDSKSGSSRLETAQDRQEIIDLPDVGEYVYLVRLLDEAGTIGTTGMGAYGLSWTEIKNWVDCVGLNLGTWELLTLHSMSREYAAQANASLEPDCKAPYRITRVVDAEDLTEEKVKQNSENIKQMFRSYKRE